MDHFDRALANAGDTAPVDTWEWLDCLVTTWRGLEDEEGPDGSNIDEYIADWKDRYPY